jgi:bacillopeptidase F (M6 metalloprotease family)
MLALPDGYTVGHSGLSKSVADVYHKMLGDNWDVTVNYKGWYAFEISKLHTKDMQAPKYLGRNQRVSPKWHQFDHYTTAVKVLVAQHKVLGGSSWKP